MCPRLVPFPGRGQEKFYEGGTAVDITALQNRLRAAAAEYSLLRILIVDDEPINVFLLQEILRECGYANVHGITDSRLVEEHIRQNVPDIILLDLMMPHVDGFAVMEQVRRAEPPETYLPILVLTADVNPETKRRALSSGATDFLTKPFDHLEVVLRIENLLRTRWQHLLLQQQNCALDERVRERTRELQEAQATVLASMAQLEEAQTEMLGRLAQAAEYRDDETGRHTYRVGRVSGDIARRLGLGTAEADLIERAAPLHDVGKIGISDTILLKPGRLTAEEFAVMQQHTVIGSRLLALGKSDLVRTAEQIAGAHHERWDGSGYPAGRQGDDIPIAAQIVAVADVFDALTHSRPYKAAWPVEAAVAEIVNQGGRQFNPRVVQAFLDLEPGAVPLSEETPESKPAAAGEVTAP